MTRTTDPRRRAWAEIDLSALRHNIGVLKERYATAGTRIMAILKADAYGHGTPIVAPACFAEGLGDFGVATTDEAIALRTLLPDAAIYILPPVTPDEADAVVEHDIVTVVSDLAFAERLAQSARRVGRTARVHLDVDTGMGRSGFTLDQVVDACGRIADLPGIEVCGVASHFARADEESADAESQHELFQQALQRLGPRVAGLDIHVSNSPGALVLGRRGAHRLIRPGLLLYGIEPAAGMLQAADLHLRPVLSLKARVVLSRALPAGATISYGKTYAVPSGGGRFATVAIGYGDGLSRRLSNTGAAGIHGQAAPIRGRICMDQLVVDVSRIEAVGAGDVATIVGTDGPFTQTAAQIAALTGHTSHEITTELLPRIPRVAVG